MFRKELIEMKKNDKKENLVEKREIIDNSTLVEMNEKYPKVSVNGVTYDLGLHNNTNRLPRLCQYPQTNQDIWCRDYSGYLFF